MVDCVTLEPLPDDKQEAPFNQPVSSPFLRKTVPFLDIVTVIALPTRRHANGDLQGVRMPRDWPMVEAMKTMWRASMNAPLAAQSDTGPCYGDTLNATDCIEALANAYNRGGDLVPITNAHKDMTTEIAVSVLPSSSCCVRFASILV